MKPSISFPYKGPRALAMRIRVVSFAIEREVDRVLADDGEITLSQFMILMPVAVNPGITQRALAHARNLTEAAISRQAEALRKRGYLERGRNPSKMRERALLLTPKGKRTLEKAARLVDRRLTELFKPMSPRQQKDVLAAFDCLLPTLGLKMPFKPKSAEKHAVALCS